MPNCIICGEKADSGFAVHGECVKSAGAVKRGEWIQVDDTKCKCSECEVITFIAQYPNGNKNFCPNCGADMRGVENG